MKFQMPGRLTNICTMLLVLVSILIIGSACSSLAQNASEKDVHADLFPGNPPICPRWAIEPWVWEDNGNTQQSSEDLVEGYLSRNIPVGAIIIDSPWATAYNNFEWNKQQYPEPQKMIDDFHSKAIRVVMWLTGFVNKESPDYQYVKEQGYVVDNGKDHKWWKGEGVHIDFTNPEAKKWWHQQLDKVLKMGIDGWKTDGGANNVDEVVETSIGTMPRPKFRRYYYADMIDYTRSVNPAGIILARPYSHQGGFACPVSKGTTHWCGDFEGGWDGLNLQLDNIYRSAQAGYGAIGCEVGGYYKVKPGKNELIRYAQFAAMVPVMINGGANGGLTNHLPWFHDEQTVGIYRYFATLHSELVPYIFSYSVESNLKGIPIIRKSNIDKRHHQLGEQFFVSGVTSDTNTKTVELPGKANWIDYWNESKHYKASSTIEYPVSLERYPIFIRAGAVIAMNVKNAVTGHGDETSADRITLVIYPFAQSSFTYHLPTGDGIEYSNVKIRVDEAGGSISISSAREGNYRLRIKCFAKPDSVKGADSWRYDEKAGYVIADKLGTRFQLEVKPLRAYSTISAD